jgi:excisionase family DNA binding protein
VNRRDENYFVSYSTTMNREQKTSLLTAEEIANMLKIKVQTVYTMARRGELEKVKLSRKCLRFRADDVQRYIERKASL